MVAANALLLLVARIKPPTAHELAFIAAFLIKRLDGCGGMRMASAKVSDG
jgi:hypothetical protein